MYLKLVLCDLFGRHRIKLKESYYIVVIKK